MKKLSGRLCRHAPRLPPRGRPARRREDRAGRPHLPRRGKKRRGDGRFRLLPLPRLHRRAHALRSRRAATPTTADDFASGTRSAIRGGTTTVIDFACPNKGETLAYGLDLWHKKADGKCSCDYGFHMTIDDWNEGIARRAGRRCSPLASRPLRCTSPTPP